MHGKIGPLILALEDGMPEESMQQIVPRGLGKTNVILNLMPGDVDTDFETYGSFSLPYKDGAVFDGASLQVLGPQENFGSYACMGFGRMPPALKEELPH